MFYVWNGRGARPEEKKAAFDYATGLCGDADSVIVLDEGENDEDEMFWAVLGDGDREYAKASHWAWRASVDMDGPQIWKISALQSQQVGSVYRATETRLMCPSSRTSPPPSTHRSRMASSFWTLYGMYSFLLAPRPGVSEKIFGWPLRQRRYAFAPKSNAHIDFLLGTRFFCRAVQALRATDSRPYIPFTSSAGPPFCRPRLWP